MSSIRSMLNCSNLHKVNNMMPSKQDLFEKFLKDNWLSPAEVFEMMIHYCNKPDTNYSIGAAVTVGEYYAKMALKRERQRRIA